MTKKKVNQQSSNVKFKIKITKIKDLPQLKSVKANIGIYAQMKNPNKAVIVPPSKISLKLIEEALTELFDNKKNK
jgi:hypothetical protein